MLKMMRLKQNLELIGHDYSIRVKKKREEDSIRSFLAIT
ncbi:hypothetical protein SLEP1_g18678 [Rubroshorea leprosula]|uniref:Uncharacterized protein n=1 Tax=Rubroshorea leprosula TaxID=152421 RepID=A0AAV5J7A3_9ROSI|nr:hypothetical protein SLEP1_g18678 [Rubroshorea leprosula]